MTSLLEQQIAAGATLGSVADREVSLSFGNDAAALEAAHHAVALYDRCHWGRIQVGGADRIRFLHNQSTNDFNRLQSGQGCDTVFVSSTARTIDLVTAYLLDDAVLLLTSPGYSQRLIEWMDRFIFFADKVDLKDVTSSTAAFSLLGPASDALLETLGATALIGQPLYGHQLLQQDGLNIRVAVGSGLALPGYTLISSSEQAADLWQRLVAVGAVPMGEQAWEQLRIEQGRPMPGRELTDDYNPLEAGLWQTVSFSKGCYIGQETIARLNTYRGVKQQLWGVRLSQAVPVNTIVKAGDEKIGVLTSCTATPSGYLGLAYLRTKAIVPDLQLQIGAAEATLVPLPFVSHDYPTSAS